MAGWRDALENIYEDLGAVPPRHVAIVPGAGVHDSQPTLVLRDRLLGALALHRAEKVSRVLVSGNRDQVEVMARWLLERGISSDVIDIDPAGRRTFVTMRRAARMHRVRDAIVCTNRFHVQRAVFLARAEGIDAVGLVADRDVYGSRRKHEAREVVARARAIFDVYVARLTRDHPA